MVNYIHEEFNQMLEEVDWMDNSTRQKAKDKSHAITPYIGYPDELLNNTRVGQLYDNVRCAV